MFGFFGGTVRFFILNSRRTCMQNKATLKGERLLRNDVFVVRGKEKKRNVLVNHFEKNRIGQYREM